MVSRVASNPQLQSALFFDSKNSDRHSTPASPESRSRMISQRESIDSDDQDARKIREASKRPTHEWIKGFGTIFASQMASLNQEASVM